DTGQFADNLSTDKASYSDVLPSINIAFDLTSDLILRTTAAQVMSRPNYSELFATSTLPGLNDGVPGNEKLNKGSVSLDPFKATQADVSLEWYFGGEGLAAITYFIKDVNSFISTRQKLNQQIGIDDNDVKADWENNGNPSACGEGVFDCWTVSEKYNAEGGRIEGVELQLQDS
ncbi:TonB-dependent receptor domain-containing protein, partial [Shewanella sp. 0m-11]